MTIENSPRATNMVPTQTALAVQSGVPGGPKAGQDFCEGGNHAQGDRKNQDAAQSRRVDLQPEEEKESGGKKSRTGTKRR